MHISTLYLWLSLISNHCGWPDYVIKNGPQDCTQSRGTLRFNNLIGFPQRIATPFFYRWTFDAPVDAWEFDSATPSAGTMMTEKLQILLSTLFGYEWVYITHCALILYRRSLYTFYHHCTQKHGIEWSPARYPWLSLHYWWFFHGGLPPCKIIHCKFTMRLPRLIGMVLPVYIVPQNMNHYIIFRNMRDRIDLSRLV